MFAQKNHSTSLNEIKSFTYPKLHTGKEWYIGFQAYDPAAGKMRRKKIKVNHIGKAADRRKFASGFIYRLSLQLEKGWNPWIEAENAKAYHTFDEVCDRYRTFLDKMFNDGNYRERTWYGYRSMLRNLIEWNKKRKVPITYIYQFNREFIVEFLDYIYMDRDNTIRTRNNYLIWLGIFDGYLVEKSYLKTKATEGVVSLKKKGYKKERQVIKQEDMIRLKEYVEKKNKYYLLACYVLHYTLIRPKEMSYIRLKDISLARQTIHIPADISKNGKDGVITLPKKIILLMLELKIFDHPGEYYLFSKAFKPGAERYPEKSFRDFWARYVRPALKFPDNYKFYSLKDTGITQMLRSFDPLSVRDQARHSSLQVTNDYTPHDIQEANELIKNYDGNF